MVACGQMLSHFKDDAAGNGSAGECAEAILVEKQVERHVAEMQKKGAIPAKKEWWQMQRRWVISIKRYQKDIPKYNVLKE